MGKQAKALRHLRLELVQLLNQPQVALRLCKVTDICLLVLGHEQNVQPCSATVILDCYRISQVTHVVNIQKDLERASTHAQATVMSRGAFSNNEHDRVRAM